MKNNFVIFCQTYKKDAGRFKFLKDSIDKFNIDKIPFYIACSQEDLKLFQSFISGKEDYDIKLIQSEDIYQNLRNYSGSILQQMVKLNFYKLNISEFYLIIDSDSYFIRPFYITDFMYDEKTPYIVMHEGKDAKLIAHGLGLSVSSVGIYALERKAKVFFGRIGKDYRFLTTPIVFSSIVLKKLEEKYSFEKLFEIVPSEAIWHGEFLLYSECIPYRQSEPFFKCMTYEAVYDLYENVLRVKQKDIAEVYSGIVIQSNMKKDSVLLYNEAGNFSNISDIAIFNFCTSNNYGALLTTYALYILLKEKGLHSTVIHYVPPWHFHWFGSVFHIFTLKYMNLSHCCRSRSDLKKLNPLFSTFVMGSDQVFRPLYVKSAYDTYFLGWTDKAKRRIAYSASFGVNYWEAADDREYTQMVKACLQSFDAISVREKSGVDICKNTFDIAVPNVLDPVFLFAGWEDLIRNASANKKFDLVLNILDDDEYVSSKIKALEKDNGLTSINILDGLIPEDWLWHIKNCSFMITDSFHGVCFAIIFQKQFVCILNKKRGMERIKSILEIFGFKSRLLDISQLDQLNELYKTKIYYEQVFEKYNELKEISFTFLENAFTKCHNEDIEPKIEIRNQLIKVGLGKKRKKELPVLQVKHLISALFAILPLGKKWQTKYKHIKIKLKLQMGNFRE